MRTRVKICGITRALDGLEAVSYGVDAIGLVFYEKSPRAVDIETARTIVREIPAFVTIAALFVNPTSEHVQAVLESVPVDLLQFHGNEEPQFCAGFGRRYIKALSMQRRAVQNQAIQTRVSPINSAQQYQDSAGLLLDSYNPEIPGGTGETFDWSAIPADLPAPLILAGGLNPENVADAIQQVQPYGVDVSSGVESEKGIKDSQKIEAFMNNVGQI